MVLRSRPFPCWQDPARMVALWRHWVFADAFPMTPSGKIQKYKLQEHFAHHQPAGTGRRGIRNQIRRR